MSEIVDTGQQQEPQLEFSMEIDGRIYTVRTFFKEVGETLQEKVERMIQREMLSGACSIA